MTEDRLAALFNRCLEARRLVQEEQEEVDVIQQMLDSAQRRLASKQNSLGDATTDLANGLHAKES